MGIKEELHDVSGITEEFDNELGISEELHDVLGITEEFDNELGISEELHDVLGIKEELHDVSGIKGEVHDVFFFEEGDRGRLVDFRWLHICDCHACFVKHPNPAFYFTLYWRVLSFLFFFNDKG